MKEEDKLRYHKLFGVRKPRIVYAKTDFIDYVLMIIMCAGAIRFAYGASWLTYFGLALCGFMIVSFIVRNGVAFKLPLLLRRPQDLIFMIAHKVENLPQVYWIGLVVVVLENVLIWQTPTLPHHVALVRTIGYWLFGLHLLVIFAYRTYSLVDHLRKHQVVTDVLLKSPWKNAGLVRKNIRYEIMHAYFTGLLTHLILVAPWFVANTYLQFSILFAPVVIAINISLQVRFLKGINSWFYRDHWLGHNSEFEFVYLHGSHHDAIPVGLIAVAGNGFLEGLMRNVLGYPTPFYNPLAAFLAYTMEIKRDIDFHQFVPGIFPILAMGFRRVGQHSTHHFGHLEPYGFGIKLDQPDLPKGMVNLFKGFPDEFSNSIRLDEELTGFKWDNARHQWFIAICEEYK